MARSDRLRILQLRTPAGGDLSLWIADSRLSRLAGLTPLERLDADRGMLIPRCRSVHTAGMKFAIDVLFADWAPAAAGLRVLALRERVVPWRVAGLLGARARTTVVIELAAGSARAAGIVAGARLYFLFSVTESAPELPS